MTTQTENSSALPRHIAELLLLVKQELEEKELITMRYTGMCAVIVQLGVHIKITSEEHLLLLKYLEANKPDSKISISDYWFPRFLIEPRIEWLDKHIKLNTKYNT